MTPGFVRDVQKARRMGVSLPVSRQARAARLDLLPSLAMLEHGLVLDGGANVGDWSAAVLAAVPTARVIAVEPAEEPQRSLNSRFGTDDRVVIVPRALAAEAGERLFHTTGHSHNSSLRRPRTDIAARYGPPADWTVTDIMPVRTTTVDAIVADRSLALLKLDVQGAELDVLGGARGTLERTEVVLLEVVFMSHYEEDATFSALHEFMLEIGFWLVGLSEPFASATGVILWADACYVRDPRRQRI